MSPKDTHGRVSVQCKGGRVAPFAAVRAGAESSKHGCVSRFQRVGLYREGRRVKLLVGVALAVLLFGTTVYVFDRPAGSIRFLPPSWSLHEPSYRYFGELSGNIPALTHALSFSLFSSAALGPGRAQAAVACLTWTLINVAFEAGQHPAAASLLAALLEPLRVTIPGVGRLQGFFLNGVFDPLDVVGILIGAAVAVLVIRWIDLSDTVRMLGMTGRT
jgi:hypothetical protein